MEFNSIKKQAPLFVKLVEMILWSRKKNLKKVIQSFNLFVYGFVGEKSRRALYNIFIYLIILGAELFAGSDPFDSSLCAKLYFFVCSWTGHEKEKQVRQL